MVIARKLHFRKLICLREEIASKMAKNQDEQLMEFVGKWASKTAPIWIPGGLIAFYFWKPENFHEIFSPYYPAIKNGILALIFISILIIIFLTARFWINRNFE